MIDIKIDTQAINNWVSESEIKAQQNKVDEIMQGIRKKELPGSDFLGWTQLQEDIPPSLIENIKDEVQMLRNNSEVIVVVGIGGSYLGARAVIEALKHPYQQLLHHIDHKDPVVLYAGNHLSSDELASLTDVLDKKEYSLIVVSKSGTTTEPAIAFRILRNHLIEKYGKEKSSERIVCITDKEKGALKKLADENNYQTYVIPDDVGGRYSVLSPVGLVPVAAAGFDIVKLLAGAKLMSDFHKNNTDILTNPILSYAVIRKLLYDQGKKIELLISYMPSLFYVIEWWKQLYGESEGKEGKGIFPAGAGFTTDLHSLGQYIQDGERHLFETLLSVKKARKEVLIPKDPNNLDGLNYLAGKDLQYVNSKAMEGTLEAHLDGKVPNIIFEMPIINEYILGQLFYLFEMACAISGYLIDVNPFDQPGVEAYKKNMFKLLGKPGF